MISSSFSKPNFPKMPRTYIQETHIRDKCFNRSITAPHAYVQYYATKASIQLVCTRETRTAKD